MHAFFFQNLVREIVLISIRTLLDEIDHVYNIVIKRVNRQGPGGSFMGILVIPLPPLSGAYPTIFLKISDF